MLRWLILRLIRWIQFCTQGDCAGLVRTFSFNDCKRSVEQMIYEWIPIRKTFQLLCSEFYGSVGGDVFE